eukprot:2324733-Prymnesium_polylepis.1
MTRSQHHAVGRALTGGASRGGASEPIDARARRVGAVDLARRVIVNGRWPMLSGAVSGRYARPAVPLAR